LDPSEEQPKSSGNREIMTTITAIITGVRSVPCEYCVFSGSSIINAQYKPGSYPLPTVRSPVRQAPRGRGEVRRRRSVNHGTPTAPRPSLPAALYSSSVATRINHPSVSAIQGSESALNPCCHAPFSVRTSTCSPGLGMRGILIRRGSPDRRAEPPNRTTSAPQRFL
jgi:hypothetical protein